MAFPNHSGLGMKTNAIVVIVGIFLVAAFPCGLSLPSAQNEGKQQEGSYAHGCRTLDLGQCVHFSCVPNLWSGLTIFSQRAKHLGGVKDVWRRTKDVFKRLDQSCQGSCMKKLVLQASGLSKAAWTRILSFFPKDRLKRCQEHLSSHTLAIQGLVYIEWFTAEVSHMWRSSIHPFLKVVWKEMVRLCILANKKFRAVAATSWAKARDYAKIAAKYADQALFKAAVWYSKQELKCLEAFQKLKPSLAKAAANMRGVQGKVFSNTGNAAKVWQSTWKTCQSLTHKAGAFWKTFLARAVGEHKRLARWHAKMLQRNPTKFFMSWMRAMRKAIALAVPGASARGRGSSGQDSKAAHRENENRKPSSAWWAGPQVDEGEQTGTNSWTELKKIVLAWSAASEQSGSQESRNEGKKISAACEWFITQSTDTSTSKVNF
jgi:hypothetical protein